jgi:glycosyltransferase involved in cell wall biosynthesis
MSALNISAKTKWELLVIDNNSTDETKHVSERYRNKLPILYIFEPNQGLSYARNRAITECHTNLLLFTDDDVTLESYWLYEFIKAAREFPEADYFGGRIIPYWPNSHPHWLKDENMALLSGLFVKYDLGENNRMYKPDDPEPYGASFAIRRRLFNNIDYFRPELGVKGNIPGRGEEAEYFIRAKENGFKGAYVGTAVCYHWIDPLRLTLKYMYRYGIQKGIAEVLIHPDKNVKGSLFQELLYGLKGLYQLVKGRGDRFRQCVINMGIQRGLRSQEK